jgi:hypothetical protein
MDSHPGTRRSMAGSDTGQIGITDDGSRFNMHYFQMRQVVGRIRTIMMGKVVKFNPGKDGQAGTVDMQPLTNQMDGGGKPTDHDTVYGLQYFRHQNGPHALIMEPAVGDIGPILIHDRDISSNIAKRDKANPASNRRFSPSDGTFMGGYLNAKATTTREMSGNSITDTASQQNNSGGNITHTATGGNMTHSATKQNNQGGAISHSSDADMTHTSGGNIIRKATQAITDTATSISHSGNTSVTGTLGVSGLLSGLGGAVFGSSSFSIDGDGNLLATSFTSGVVTPAVGDVLFRNTTNWDVLPPGPVGYVFTTEGPGTPPTWQAPGGGGGGNYIGAFTVALLPAAPTTWSTATATNGRKIGEGAGLGTGVPVYFSGGGMGWRTMSLDQPVAS